MRPHLILRQVCQAEPVQCRVQPDGDVVEHQLPLDPHLQLHARLSRTPMRKPAIGRQAQIDAVMVGQILRPLRPRPLGEVSRRANDRHADVRTDAHGDHVLRHLLAQADTGVIALGDDIGQAVVDDDLHPDIGVVRQQLRQSGPEHRRGRVLARRDADGAGGLVAKLAQRGQLRFDLSSRGPTAPSRRSPPPSAQHSAWCGSGVEAEPCFEPADGLAERRLRDPELRRGPVKLRSRATARKAIRSLMFPAPFMNFS